MYILSPQNNLKIQVLICVFLGIRFHVLIPSCKKSIFFWGKILVLCNERVPFLGKIMPILVKQIQVLKKHPIYM
jgi:hypothetical protein